MHQHRHGSLPLRGTDHVPRSPSTEGRFGRLFRKLPPFGPPDDLLSALAASMREPAPNPGTQFDNPDIPAGFTFLGQFLDHDITFDRTSSLERQNDPDALINFRTPKYDLDSVYGAGPANSPQLYDAADPDKLLLDRAEGPEDVPRNSQGTAIIGDPRNDENLIICQLQIAFIKLHNAMVDHVRGLGRPPGRVFEEAQRSTQWHYQWMVVHDFLPRTVGQDVVDSVLERPGKGKGPFKTNLTFYEPKKNAFMPVEFSVAAYRFGHSQIRPGYLINAQGGAALFQAQAGETNLNGGRPLTPKLKIDWHHFFDIPGDSTVPQRSRQIDTLLSGPLFTLPASVVAPPDPIVSLAERNFLRGKALGLPSGQQVAAEMGATVLSNAELEMPSDPGWQDQAPLWFYVLKEAKLQKNGRRLGEVGARIVAEVFVGLLAEDPFSFLRLRPDFRPEPPIAQSAGTFNMGHLLKFAGAA